MNLTTQQQAKPNLAPSIANFTPGTSIGTSNSEIAERKGSSKKTSINLGPNSNQPNADQKITQPLVQPNNQKAPLTNASNPKPQQNLSQQVKKLAQNATNPPVVSKPPSNPSQNSKIETSSYILKPIMDKLLKGTALSQQQIQKVCLNYRMYVEFKRQDSPFDSISKIQGKSPTGEMLKILNIPELNKIQDLKSKLPLNLFWSTIIKNVCNKIPFLSVKGCFQITKLHISMNRDYYCQTDNQQVFNVKISSQPTLYPILNNKMTINTSHRYYKQTFHEIENLSLNLFRGMNSIFKQIANLKVQKHQKQKYKSVFKLLQTKQSQKKKIIVDNLIKSFAHMIKLVQDETFDQYLPYFQCVIESIWHYYVAQQKVFGIKICSDFIYILNQNYKFFNTYGTLRSSLADKFIDYVQKITIRFLFNQPNIFNQLSNQSKKQIFNSNLEMFNPIKYLLKQNFSNQRDQPIIINYPLKGLHWQQLVNSVIKLDYTDFETINFIINSIVSILAENADIFWQDPHRFDPFLRFCEKYIHEKKYEFGENQSNFYNMLRIGISLMGKSINQNDDNGIQDISLQYPQNRKLPYVKNVYHEFSQYFMKMSKKQFMQILIDELKRLISEGNQYEQYDQNYQNNYNLIKPDQVIKEYLLKLILSQPTLIVQIKKYIRQLTEVDLVNFIAVKTIKNPSTPTQLIDSAFTAIDQLLSYQSTSPIISSILGLGQIQTNKNLSSFAEYLFKIPQILPFVSRHCQVLIDLEYQSKQWTKQLLKNFSKNCDYNQGQFYARNHKFTSSYSQLLNTILTRINTGLAPQVLQLKPYINVSFVIDSIKYHLKFDKYENKYINVIVQQQNNKTKLLSLIQCIRLFNVILFYEHKVQNTKTDDNSLNYNYINSKKQLSNQSLISNYQAKKLGIQDKQFHTQVKSLTQQTTSYINALTFILVNTTQQQKKKLKQINFQYETLIFETIQNLVKLNPNQDLKAVFNVFKGNRPLMTLQDYTIMSNYEKSYLNLFVSYVQRTLNQVGVQIVVFGRLIQDPQRSRKLIDSVRNKLQDPAIRQRIKSKLFLKTISTLGRYFRTSINEIQIKKGSQLVFESLQMQQHFEYLLQSIVAFIVPYKDSKKANQLIIVDATLSNIYGGLLTVQTISRKYFVKWVKNIHLLLLNDVNLKYLRNVPSQFGSQKQNEYSIGQQYFKLISLFLNSQQYMSEQQFNIIKNINNLSDQLQRFILNIVRNSELSKLSIQLVDILLEILLISLGLYLTLKKGDKNFKTDFLTQVLNNLQNKKQLIKKTSNLILVEILLFNQLNMKYTSSEIDINNFNLWPLQMNCVDKNISTPKVQAIIKSLKSKSLNNLSFSSICNGLMFLFLQSKCITWNQSNLVDDIFDVYKYFCSLPTPPPRLLSQKTTSILPLKSTYQTDLINYQAFNTPYKKIWILQLLLTILTRAQNDMDIPKVQKELHIHFIQDQEILKRFGYLMKKLAFYQSETHIPWIQYLNEIIQSEILPGQTVTYAEKLQLYQLLKMFNFILACHNWSSQFADKYSDLVYFFVGYRQVFEKLPFSNKKIKPSSVQQVNLQTINISNYLSKHQMMSSGIKQFEKQKLNTDALKSTNSLQLMHQIINLQISSQYALICLTIADPMHLRMFNKNPFLADISKWNFVLLQLTEALIQRHFQMIANGNLLKLLLDEFTNCYQASDKTILLTTEMLFTNSSSLSCCLNSSYDLLGQLVVETLDMLLNSINETNKSLQKQLHSDYKLQNDRFMGIINSLRKHDTINFDISRYDPSEHKAKMSQTFREGISKTFNSQSIKNSNKVR